MKWVTLLAADRSHHVGLMIDSQNTILDLFEAHQKKHLPTPPDLTGVEVQTSLTQLLKLIELQDKWIPILKPWFASVSSDITKLPPDLFKPITEAVLLAPIPRPTSCRDGYAFRQHVESARRGRGVPMIPEFDDFPVFYFTNHLAVTGPGEIYVMEKALERLDFELEVAIVIGKEGRNIRASEADQYIFGYTIMNDWSARELQTQEMKLNLGPAKGKDFATSIGPFLVTPDELKSRLIAGPHGNRYDLRMQAFHNGKAVSDGNLKDMTWTFGQIIERASYGVTLYPGEVIGSGTVGTGCYMELNLTTLKDSPVWIQPGDDFSLEVDLLGKLDNRICKAHG